MKIRTIILFTFLTLSLFASATEPKWPQNPVLGMIGASFVNKQTPYDSVFGGFAIAGGSYLDLETALNQSFTFIFSGIRTANEAQGSAFSFDFPNTGTQGYAAQFERLLSHVASPLEGMTTPPGKMKLLYIGLMNDCLHVHQCGNDFSQLINNTQNIVNSARALGVPIIINGYPAYENLDPALYISTYAPFGVTDFVSKAEYNQLKAAHKEAFENQDGVIYVNLYEDGSTIDGLHWDQRSMRKAARRLTAKIVYNLSN